MLQVLQAWDDCTLDLTIETLVQKLQDWVRRGLVDYQVWQDIQELISYDLPFVTVVESCRAPISTPSTANFTLLESKTFLKINSNYSNNTNWRVVSLLLKPEGCPGSSYAWSAAAWCNWIQNIPRVPSKEIHPISEGYNYFGTTLSC